MALSFGNTTPLPTGPIGRAEDALDQSERAPSMPTLAPERPRPARRFDHAHPIRRTEAWQRSARAAVGQFFMRAFMATGERPSSEHVAYFRDVIREQEEVERAYLDRLDRIAPVGPAQVVIRRVATSREGAPTE